MYTVLFRKAIRQFRKTCAFSWENSPLSQTLSCCSFTSHCVLLSALQQCFVLIYKNLYHSASVCDCVHVFDCYSFNHSFIHASVHAFTWTLHTSLPPDVAASHATRALCLTPNPPLSTHVCQVRILIGRTVACAATAATATVAVAVAVAVVATSQRRFMRTWFTASPCIVCVVIDSSATWIAVRLGLLLLAALWAASSYSCFHSPATICCLYRARR